jgi:uncharacterized protein YcbK (DUF882 family)
MTVPAASRCCGLGALDEGVFESDGTDTGVGGSYSNPANKRRRPLLHGKSATICREACDPVLICRASAPKPCHSAIYRWLRHGLPFLVQLGGMPKAVSTRTVVTSCVIAGIGLLALVGVARARQRSYVRRAQAALVAVTDPGTTSASSAPLPNTLRLADPFERLPAVTFHNRNGERSLTTRLYGQAGQIDESAATSLDAVLADTRDPKQPKTTQIDRRLLQLLYRTAYHYEIYRIEVTSAYRMQGRKREGLHALGRAIDFAMPGVKAQDLASYLRKLARVGVGVYTHARTRFVHLDVREQSYHWLDASPPGRSWRGMSIGDKSLAKRDAAYDRASDWPEGLTAPKDQ